MPCPNASWSLRMRPTGSPTWTTLVLFAEEGTSDVVTWPGPYDMGFSVLVFADRLSAPMRIELPGGRVERLESRQAFVLSYAAVPGTRDSRGRIVDAPSMERDDPVRIADVTSLTARDILRSAYTPGTSLWVWGPGTSPESRDDMRRLGLQVASSGLVKLVPDSGETRLAGPPLVACPGSELAAPRRSTGGWGLAAAIGGMLAVFGGLVWLGSRKG